MSEPKSERVDEKPETVSTSVSRQSLIVKSAFFFSRKKHRLEDKALKHDNPGVDVTQVSKTDPPQDVDVPPASFTELFRYARSSGLIVLGMYHLLIFILLALPLGSS